MHIAIPNPAQVTLRLTDAEAEQLVKELQVTLARRRALIAKEPAMAAWNDYACGLSGRFDDKGVSLSVSICAN